MAVNLIVTMKFQSTSKWILEDPVDLMCRRVDWRCWRSLMAGGGWLTLIRSDQHAHIC